MDAMTRPLLVFLAVLTVDLLVISYVPALSLVTMPVATLTMKTMPRCTGSMP
jgi:hypothetical protein